MDMQQIFAYIPIPMYLNQKKCIYVIFRHYYYTSIINVYCIYNKGKYVFF